MNSAYVVPEPLTSCLEASRKPQYQSIVANRAHHYLNPTNPIGNGMMQSHNPFGQQQPQQNVFGQPQPQQSMFGSINNNPFGSRPSTNTFGSNNSSTFGTSSFAQPQPSSFAQSNNSSVFGQPSSNPFGQSKPQTSTLFGQSSTSSIPFGQTNTTSNNNPFSQNKPQNNTFGSLNNSTSSFGQSSMPTSFGQPQTNTFGQQQSNNFNGLGTSSFGQNNSSFAQSAPVTNITQSTPLTSASKATISLRFNPADYKDLLTPKNDENIINKVTLTKKKKINGDIPHNLLNGAIFSFDKTNDNEVKPKTIVHTPYSDDCEKFSYNAIDSKTYSQKYIKI